MSVCLELQHPASIMTRCLWMLFAEDARNEVKKGRGDLHPAGFQAVADRIVSDL